MFLLLSTFFDEMMFNVLYFKIDVEKISSMAMLYFGILMISNILNVEYIYSYLYYKIVDLTYRAKNPISMLQVSDSSLKLIMFLRT